MYGVEGEEGRPRRIESKFGIDTRDPADQSVMKDVCQYLDYRGFVRIGYSMGKGEGEDGKKERREEEVGRKRRGRRREREGNMGVPERCLD